MFDPIERLPPHSKDAERALIGGILRNPEMLQTVRAITTADGFYFDANQRVYQAMCDLEDSHAPVDLVSLNAILHRRKDLDDIGGVTYLAELWEAVPTGASVEYHAKIVHDAAMVRRLIYTANEILRDAYDRTAPAADLIADASGKLADLAIKAHGLRDNVRQIAPVMQEVLVDVDNRIAAGNDLTGIPTGYYGIDSMLGGLRSGQLIVVGARPSVGKTALGVNIATSAAIAGYPVLLFSLEMPVKEIASRVLSSESGVPMHVFTRGRFLDQVNATLLNATTQGRMRTAGLYVDDSSSITATQMMQVTRLAIRRHKIQAVFVDYLQLIRPENHREQRVQQVSAITLKLKNIARDCGIPVVCLCQLNREVESRPDQRPRLSDLRESGSIEQDADVVILLHRPAGQEDHAEAWNIEAIIGKQRNGPTGTVPLSYRRGVMRFETT